jgi:hypothetical protein
VKDLCKRLGIGNNAPVDEIRRAIAASADPIRREAEFILLNPRRRTVYDRNHRVLSTIGPLRGGSDVGDERRERALEQSWLAREVVVVGSGSGVDWNQRVGDEERIAV